LLALQQQFDHFADGALAAGRGRDVMGQGSSPDGAFAVATAKPTRRMTTTSVKNRSPM